MYKGSASGLRCFPFKLSSQLPCRLLHIQALAARGHSTALALPPRSRIFTTSHHLENVSEDRNVDAPATSSCPPSCPSVHANGVPHSGRRPTLPGLAARPADRNAINLFVGADSFSDMQVHPQHGSVSHSGGPLDQTERKCPSRRRRTLLWIMLTTKSHDRAWTAYQELLSYRVVIPHHSLHQLARLLASIKPRTRTIHLQLLCVLSTLRRNGGRLRLWEWNTLIDSAGKQWHKTRLEDYENALEIFNKKGALPTGTTFSTDDADDAETDSCVTRQDPDIWTYNILLSIASRSNLPFAVRHASSLLLASGLSPNRYTHLCLLRHFAIRKDLASIRSTLRKMKQQGLEVGVDGVNACLWAYALNGRFDVALRVYRVLRSNSKQAPDLEEGYDVNEDACYIRDTVGLDVLDGLEPNEITYTMMIQTLAYHGDLKNALGVFVDMLSTPNHEAVVRTDVSTATQACYKPSMAAFRGLFLGFARHGRDLEHRAAEADPVATLFPSSQTSWDEDALETVFAAFLQLPSSPKPTGRVIYWILTAFDRTSGSDTAKLREVWNQLEAKYGGGWGGRLEEIKKSIFA